jgi:divalent metal cation (Fe/Co/Zn/Cd) transporter
MVLLWGTVRDVGRRLMDGVDPQLSDALAGVVREHSPLGGTSRLRWSGHRLHAEITVPLSPDARLADLSSVAADLEESAKAALPHLGSVTVVPSITQSA